MVTVDKKIHIPTPYLDLTDRSARAVCVHC